MSQVSHTNYPIFKLTTKFYLEIFLDKKVGTSNLHFVHFEVSFIVR